MTAVRSGIPTTYRKAAFRSRLEARWAVFFDLIGWKWTYEPLDADGYIPDFLIHGKSPFFVEVGPCILQADYDAKTAKPDGAAASLGHDLLIVGVSPLAEMEQVGAGSVQVGLLGEFYPGMTAAEIVSHGPWCESHVTNNQWSDPITPRPCNHGAQFAWDPGVWGVCGDHLAIYHSVMSYDTRPCGDGHEPPDADPDYIDRLWNHAGSVVQWKPWR